MIFFYCAILFAFIPITAFVLNTHKPSKGVIFGIFIIVIGLASFIFLSDKALIGFLNKQKINNSIIQSINSNGELNDELIKKLVTNIEKDQVINWVSEYVIYSIKEDKLNSAESIIMQTEDIFKTQEEKFIYYALYRSLRDAKFPNYSEFILTISFQGGMPCKLDSGKAKVYISDGPKLPLAELDFFNGNNIKITNDNSLVPGFDLTSALMNAETVNLDISINCTNNSFYNFNSLFLFADIDKSLLVKIKPNQWSLIKQ